jgi:hypothetical protein
MRPHGGRCLAGARAISPTPEAVLKGSGDDLVLVLGLTADDARRRSRGHPSCRLVLFERLHNSHS